MLGPVKHRPVAPTLVAMRPPPARSAPGSSWLAVTVVASLLFSLLRLPSPVLFGSLVGGMVHALTARDELDLPAPLASGSGRRWSAR